MHSRRRFSACRVLTHTTAIGLLVLIPCVAAEEQVRGHVHAHSASRSLAHVYESGADAGVSQGVAAPHDAHPAATYTKHMLASSTWLRAVTAAPLAVKLLSLWACVCVLSLVIFARRAKRRAMATIPRRSDAAHHPGASAQDKQRKRLLLVTDTWDSVNGAATTLRQNVGILSQRGWDVVVVHPGLFTNVGFPGYSEVRLTTDVFGAWAAIHASCPDAIHIATEGPLGLLGKLYAAAHGRVHSTSYHTKFPEYLTWYLHLPLPVGYAFMRQFHGSSAQVLVTTNSVREELVARGFDADRLMVWKRGVNMDAFHPSYRSASLRASLGVSDRLPLILCVSRLGVEKNLAAFCSLRVPGRLVLVGDGPQRKTLERMYPHVIFTGYKRGAELAAYYASADVFVFPSRTDTFGVVMLEAMASGTPVAAFPVTGPVDVITHGMDGALSNDIDAAVATALACDRDAVRASALRWTWHACADILEGVLRTNMRAAAPTTSSAPDATTPA